jgi:hypothetical protein
MPSPLTRFMLSFPYFGKINWIFFLQVFSNHMDEKATEFYVSMSKVVQPRLNCTYISDTKEWPYLVLITWFILKWFSYTNDCVNCCLPGTEILMYKHIWKTIWCILSKRTSNLILSATAADANATLMMMRRPAELEKGDNEEQRKEEKGERN